MSPHRSRKIVLLVVTGGLLIAGCVALLAHRSSAKIEVAAPKNQPIINRKKPDTLAERLSALSLTKAETRIQGNKTWLKVNGKSIGAYNNPAESSIRRVKENAHLYQPPLYFATLTSETIKLKLEEDFELGQLVAFKDYRDPDGKKVYTTERHTDVLPLRSELIVKLIKLRQRLREKDVKVTRFWITSGFRTPEYNHSIGGAAYSRHCYGDAVDLCIDEDGDKRMDDLNGDGKIDRKDGLVIANVCRELEAEDAVALGGIGVYEWDSDDSARCHVHIDCRGFVTRWGQVGAGKYKKSFVWWPKAEFQEDESGE
ncbi:MAG: D-Ala-D-Ala carboxypeptidase family metallohydrolase [Planctomycetota bacterium]